jgi:hypothetical protein
MFFRLCNDGMCGSHQPGRIAVCPTRRRVRSEAAFGAALAGLPELFPCLSLERYTLLI